MTLQEKFRLRIDSCNVRGYRTGKLFRDLNLQTFIYGKLLAGQIPQFFDSKDQNHQRKAKNRAKNAVKSNNFPPNSFAKFFANFGRVFFSSKNGKCHLRTVSKNSNMKIQHRTMFQSIMPNRWSGKPNQCADASGEKDFNKDIFLRLTVLHPLPTNSCS